MGQPADQKQLLCVACRETYAPDHAKAPGCPHCGGLSWIAAWLALEPQNDAAKIPHRL